MPSFDRSICASQLWQKFFTSKFHSGHIQQTLILKLPLRAVLRLYSSKENTPNYGNHLFLHVDSELYIIMLKKPCRVLVSVKGIFRYRLNLMLLKDTYRYYLTVYWRKPIKAAINEIDSKFVEHE